MKLSRTASLLGRFFTLTSVLGAAALTTIPSRALAGCVAPPPGLVSWWRAEGNGNDSFGTNPGTLIGGLTFNNGEVGQAFNLDGVDDHIIVANASSLNFGPNQDFSIEAWVQPLVSTTTFDLMTIVDKRNAPDITHGVGYEIALTGGRLECRISDSITDVGTSFGAAGPDLRDGGFHHVAVTFVRNSTTGGHYYVDGVAVLTFDPSVELGDLSNDQPLRIGSHPTPSVFANFKGKIDEVSIYQRALSATEVQSIYNAGSAGKCVATNPSPCVPAPSGLVNWWAAEGNASDSLGSLNGNLYGGTTFAPGKVGQALSFDGINDSVTNSTWGLTNILDSYTMELWAWPTAGRASTPENTSGVDGHGNQRYAIFPYQGPTGGTVGAGISVGTNGVSVFEHGDVYLPALLVFDAPIVGWTHIAVVYSNRTPSLYLNGVLARNGLTSLNPSCPSTWLGERGAASANQGWYAGLLDEVSIYNRSLSVAEVQAVYNAGSAGKCQSTPPTNCVPAPAGLVSWWAAEGNATDNIGHLNGYPYGGTTFAPGKVGQAFSFDGINDSITNSMSGLTNILDSYTMELWAWPTAGRASTPENTSGVDGHGNQRYAVFPHVGPTGGTVGAGISVGTNGVSVMEAGDTYLPALLVFDAPIIGWTHVAVVYSNRQPSLYLNGVLVRTGLTSVNPSCPSTWLGERGPASANQGYYAGLLDEYAIYNRSLSAAEIQAIYSPGKCGSPIPPDPPFIVSQPTNQTVLAGGTASFTVVAGGTPPLSYQWRHEGTNVGGAVNPKLTLTNVQACDAGSYVVVVSNLLDSATSSNAVLTVNMAATCAPPPSGLVSWWRAEGNAQDAADGNNGVLVNGIGFAAGKVGQAFNLDGVRGHFRVADQPNLRLTNALTMEAWVNPAGSGSPRSIVSKWDGVIGPDQRSYVLGLQADGSPYLLLSPNGTASGYAVVFGSNAVPVNQWTHVAGTYDGAALRIYVNGALQSQTPYTQGIFPGTTDLGIGANVGGTVVGDVSSPFIGLFTGKIDEASIYNRALTPMEIQALFTAGTAGKCATATAPVILSQPTNVTITAGGNASFTVAATGTPPLSYQWRFNGTNLDGATLNTLLLTNVQFADSGAYSVIVSNAAGTTNSSSAMLTIHPPPPCTPTPAGIISWWRGEGNGEDYVGPNGGTLSGGLTFTNGEVHRGFSLDGVDDYVLVSNAPSLNFGAGQDFSIEAWIQPEVSSTTFDVMTIVDKRNAPDISSGIGYEVAVVSGRLECRISDSLAGGGTSFGPAGPDLRDGHFHHVAVTLVRNSSTGGHYYVDGAEVLTFNPTVEPGDLTNDQPLRIGRHATPSVSAQFKGKMDEVSIYQRALSATEVQAIYNAASAGKCVILTPPAIGSQPASQTVVLGDDATFTVTAAGTPPLSYQWQFNGTNILDANNSAFTFSNVQFANAGNYAVLVSNPAGSLLSSNAVLNVNPPPPCAPLPAGLISWWRAENDAADATANNPGTLVGGLTFTNGQVGQAFNLDGLDDFVLVSNALSLNFGANQDFSIEAWIQPQVSSTTFDVMTIVDKRNAPDISHGIGYELAVVGGRLECRISDSIADVGTSFGAAGPDLRDGRFHHVAVTIVRNSTTGGRYYVDGSEALTFNPTVEPGDLSNDQPLRIGRHPTPSVFAQFKGKIDEVSIYQRALSAAEVQATHNAGRSGRCIEPPTINAHPAGVRVNPGADVTFTVTAAGTPALRYQWRRDSLPIADATGTELSLTNIDFSHAGLYSVRVTNAFGSVISSNALLVVNQPPVADASARPPLVISPNNTNAIVVLDGSRSSDPDGDSLQYFWFKAGDSNAFVAGVVATVTLPVGSNALALMVNDGLATGRQDFVLEVITAGQAVGRLVELVKLGATRSQPLIATLRAAIAAIDRSNPTAALNQLRAFQNQVRAQVQPIDPALAEQFIQAAQEVIDILSGAGGPGVKFRAVTRHANGKVKLQFSAVRGPTYIIEASPDLVHWEKIGVAVDSGGGDFELEDAGATQTQMRFYRVFTP